MRDNRVASLTPEQLERKRARDRVGWHNRQVKRSVNDLTDAQLARRRENEARRVRTPEQLERKLAKQRERNAWRKVHRLYLKLLRQRGVIA